MIQWIKKVLRADLKAAIWTLNQFSNKKIIQEFFLDCSEIDMRRFISGIVKAALIKVYEYDFKINAQEYQTPNLENAPKSPILNLLHIITCMIP
jgi:hypothetical protein